MLAVLDRLDRLNGNEWDQESRIKSEMNNMVSPHGKSVIQWITSREPGVEY